MILINVLPDHLRPVKRTPLPYIGAAVAISLALFMVASMFIGVMAELSGTNGSIDDTNAQLKDLEPIVEKHNELTAQQLRLQNKIETIEEILSDRKIWSEHLHKLAVLAPDNFWLSAVRTSLERFQRRVPRIDKDGKTVLGSDGQPVMDRKTVNLPVLEVSGYVIPGEDGYSNIAPLTAATTNDPEFSANFELTRPSFEDTEFDGFAVRSFTLQYLIRSNTGGNQS